MRPAMRTTPLQSNIRELQVKYVYGIHIKPLVKILVLFPRLTFSAHS